MTTPLHDQLLGSGLTIAVAESLTAGKIQSILAERDGSSGFFAGGVTAYNIDQKVRLLGVVREVAEADSCVSYQVAVQMALGVRDLFEADMAIATTGYAVPSEGVPQPFAWVCVVRPDLTVDSEQVFAPVGLSRVQVQEYIAAYAVRMMAAFLEAG
jgi:nicotinamide-nucleotide amidase